MTPPVRVAGQDPGHRRAGQAERPADRRRRIPGRLGGQDRPVTLPPRGAHPAGPQGAAFPLGQPAPDAIGDPVADGVVQARIEVQDNGGPWNQGMVDPTRHHGLDIVRAVADEWGIDGDHTTRTIWARFDWPE
jgi:hypothetical protein